MKCRFCKGQLSEHEEKKDLYCHTCGALTYEGICEEMAKKLRANGWANATKENIVSVVQSIIIEHEKVEEKIKNIRRLL